MYQFKRLLVCLDGSEMDDTLIKAASEYASFGQADNIYFVTAVKSLEVPESVKRDYPDLHTPLDEQMEREMKDSIKGQAHQILLLKQQDRKMSESIFFFVRGINIIPCCHRVTSYPN